MIAWVRRVFSGQRITPWWERESVRIREAMERQGDKALAEEREIRQRPVTGDPFRDARRRVFPQIARGGPIEDAMRGERRGTERR